MGPRKKFDDIFSRLGTIHECDRQTDGRTNTGREQRPRLRIASRGKNVFARTLTLVDLVTRISPSLRSGIIRITGKLMVYPLLSTQKITWNLFELSFPHDRTHARTYTTHVHTFIALTSVSWKNEWTTLQLHHFDFCSLYMFPFL